MDAFTVYSELQKLIQEFSLTVGPSGGLVFEGTDVSHFIKESAPFFTVNHHASMRSRCWVNAPRQRKCHLLTNGTAEW